MIELPRVDIFFLVVLVFFVLAYVGIQRLRVDPPANDPKAFMKTRASRPTSPPRPLAVCAGDSITRGAASVNYVDILASRLPDWDFVNAGVNSELAYNLALRLDPIIELEPEAVTVLIGSNDVNATFGLHSALGYYALQRLPERPNLLFYKENLTLIVRRLKKETKARIALLSLPPIGEEIGHYAFLRTEEYSSVVRGIAKDEGVEYLPFHERLVSYLESAPMGRSPGFHRIAATQLRAIRARLIFGRSLDQISAANGYRLLVDGIHLNTHGAVIAADLVESFLRSGRP